MKSSIIFKVIGVIVLGLSSIQSYSQTYIQYVDSADYYIRREMWDKAEEMTVAALRKMPANKLNYLLWSNLGDIRSSKGDNPGALQAFDIALASAPTDSKILSKRAYVYLLEGKNQEAMDDINLSLKNDSIQEWALKMRAMLELGDGKFDAAQNDYEMLIRHFPANHDAYIGLGKIFSARGDSEKAASMFRRSLETKDTEEAWFLLVLLQIENDKVPRAKEDLLVALKRYPRSGNLFLLRGLIHKINFENDAAMIDRKIALDHGADRDLAAKLLPAK